jgi:serine/threonine protein kinase
LRRLFFRQEVWSNMTTEMQIVGDYELLDKIAEGGMGAVYRARHRGNGQLVALKIMPAYLASKGVLLQRFRREYEVARSLQHPHIVRALDFGFVGGSPYLVMEYVEGESLGQRLEREGRLPEEEALRIITQVAEGLHCAHQQGLVHRDVKPDNILLTREGQAKLADLGLVKELETETHLTRTGRGLGTPNFMAPEQFRDAKHVDARCDIYALGATLYMMVTGELPFKELGPVETWLKKLNNDLPPARQLVPTLSERVSWAIARAMSADKEQRPASCREFLEDLTGRSTRQLTPQVGVTTIKDIWYVVYQDRQGVSHSLKGSTAAIRQRLPQLLQQAATPIRAARQRSGPFEPLRHHPEFRDLVLGPLALTPAAALPSRHISSRETVSNSLDAETSLGTPSRPLASPPDGKKAQERLPSPHSSATNSATAPPSQGPGTPAPLSGAAAPHFQLETAPAIPLWLPWLLLFLAALLLGFLLLFLLPS